jgi:NAD(P)-dependent dehydrogenase (short-subunit alcohol dehydrogenase family)
MAPAPGLGLSPPAYEPACAPAAGVRCAGASGALTSPRPRPRPRPCRRRRTAQVNSFAARLPLKNMAAYSGSKFALAGYTDALRAEVAQQGVHVASVHPGERSCARWPQQPGALAARRPAQEPQGSRPGARAHGPSPAPPALATAPAGVIKSNFLERATWFGAAGEEARLSMKTMFEGGEGLLQTPEQIAQEVYDAVQQRREEVMVGAAFGVLGAAYRFTGLNVFNLR